MVYRATTLVKEELANDLRIRSLSFTNSRCQAGMAGSDGLIGWPSVADRRQGLAAAWRSHVADSPPSQATLGHDTPSPPSARPLLRVLSFPSLLPPSLAPPPAVVRARRHRLAGHLARTASLLRHRHSSIVIPLPHRNRLAC